VWFRRENKSDEESREALAMARAHLRQVEQRADKVTSLSREIKEFRERNHFADALEAIIVRPGGKENDTGS
jgi:hypothetical protein